MAVTLTLVGKTPGQTQWGLDTFTEHYKCDATADVVLTDPDVPEMTEAHPDYQFMFVTARYCSETSESASALDLTYTGCIRDSGGEDPTPALPSQQHTSGNQVQSASSSRSVTGIILTSPATIQFYAPSTTLSYISAGGPGTDLPPDPSSAPEVITWTVGDTSYSIGNLVSDLISIFFSSLITTTIESTEVVAGQFWNNVARKTLSYVPYIFDVPSGPLVTLASPGNGYVPTDSLSISAGGEGATIIVDTVGGVFGGSGILAYHVTVDTFTVPQTLLAASGGSGTGALFNVIIIP